DQVRRAAALVAVGAFAHEVDVAHRLLAAVAGRGAGRPLAQHELARRDALQRRQHVAHAYLGGIDLVDENDVRDVVVLDVFQERRQRHHPLGRGLADQHGGVAHREGGEGILLELDRTRDVKERPLVAEIVDRGDIDLGAHAALARLGSTVADRGACASRSAPADGPRGVENALEQAGLAPKKRPAPRHHAVRAAAWSASGDGLRFDVVHDNVLPSARWSAPESSGRWSLRISAGAKPCPGNRFTLAEGSQSTAGGRSRTAAGRRCPPPSSSAISAWIYMHLWIV